MNKKLIIDLINIRKNASMFLAGMESLGFESGKSIIDEIEADLDDVILGEFGLPEETYNDETNPDGFCRDWYYDRYYGFFDEPDENIDAFIEEYKSIVDEIILE